MTAINMRSHLWLPLQGSRTILEIQAHFHGSVGGLE